MDEDHGDPVGAIRLEQEEAVLGPVARASQAQDPIAQEAGPL